MRLTYHNLVIELPVEGIKAVESVEITQRLNEHGHAVGRAMADGHRHGRRLRQQDRLYTGRLGTRPVRGDSRRWTGGVCLKSGRKCDSEH